MAALESVKAYPIVNACTGSPKCSEESHSHPQEIIKPSIVELTKEVRTNILCTVEGCGKILPNTPALNMHLVKSHRVKDGLVNPTVRKDMKGSQKLYCCPIEGCPRGPNRPFSQFSLVKQHFMKMHAEKKHKCSKCNNGYSTEWDLRRHTEDCGKTYRCTCGCPYASRAALLSHVYRTGHEVPNEHRHPPVKKRKMEKMISATSEVKTCEFPYQVIGSAREFSGDSVSADRRDDATEAKQQTSCPPKTLHKLLLPKPKVALVNVPVMQLAHLPFLLPSTESGALRSVMLTVDSQGSFRTIHLLPQSIPAVRPHLDTKTLGLRDSMSTSRPSFGPTSTGVQANLEPIGFPNDSTSGFGSQRGRSTSTNIQTDMSYLSSGPMGVGVGAGGSMGVCSMGETSVSSCAQTDISVSAQVLLPVSVETQTFPSNDKVTSTIGAQTESHGHSHLSDSSITRQTQTQYPAVRPEERVKMGQAIMCSELFDSDSLSVSTQTALHNPLPAAGSSIYDDEKDVGGLCFGVQTDEFHSNSVADNQTQTMALIHDLENILSGHQVLPESPHGCGPGMGSVQEHNAGIDFDFEEFLNAVHIQTQTEESELGGLGADTPLESLDIQTQTDFLLLDGLGSEGLGRSQPSDLDQEMFDTQTQTDLNFLLNTGNHIPLGNILRQSSFSMSTESSDTETQTELQPLSPGLSNQPLCSHSEQARILSSSETQTSARYSEALGHLFLTSNETQTVMDDFLCADMAWNMESHLSSVETQTCEELFALFQQPEKPNS